MVVACDHVVLLRWAAEVVSCDLAVMQQLADPFTGCLLNYVGLLSFVIANHCLSHEIETLYPSSWDDGGSCWLVAPAWCAIAD